MATVTPTNADLLDDCNRAIRAVLTVGTATTIYGARSVTRADLDDLIKTRKFLEGEIRRERGDTDFRIADFSGV